MKQCAAVLAFVLATLLGIFCYIFFQYSNLLFNMGISSESLPQVAVDVPLAAESQGPPSSNLPSPPPRLRYETTLSTPVPHRTLVGSIAIQLEEIKEYLPEGAHVATYPVGEREEKMAAGSTDLDGDGNIETVVIFKESKESHLELLVLQRGKIFKRVPLYGFYIQNYVNYDKVVPFALRDITGDGMPEIIVTTSVGASLGSELQVFSLVGSSLRQIANASGHLIQIHDKGSGQASVIVARSRYESKSILYEWNGEHFEQKNR